MDGNHEVCVLQVQAGEPISLLEEIDSLHPELSVSHERTQGFQIANGAKVARLLPDQEYGAEEARGVRGPDGGLSQDHPQEG